jgi:hypothetical protein
MSFDDGAVTLRRPDPHGPKAKGSDPLFSRSNECFFTMSDNTPHPRVNADRMCEFRFPMDEICLIPRVAPRQKKAAGGARRDRTDDLMLAKHALSQLSYGPREQQRNGHELRDKWWAWDDSNVRPHPYHW